MLKFKDILFKQSLNQKKKKKVTVEKKLQEGRKKKKCVSYYLDVRVRLALYKEIHPCLGLIPDLSTKLYLRMDDLEVSKLAFLGD
jgi:hypothetical protein